MRKLLLALLLQGCIVPPDPWGRSEITVDGSEEFATRIGMTADEWNWALQDRCGWAPITIVPHGGHPVREIGAQQWLDDGYDNSWLGFFDGDQVAIRCCLGGVKLNVPVHELGHSLGLPHISYDEDLLSVMHPFAFTDRIKPTQHDVDLAADLLGCP